MNSLELRAANYSAEASHLVKLCQSAFVGAPWMSDLEQTTESYQSEWERIASGRGTNLPTIAFVGPINAGKSWLAQQLFKNADFARSILPDGEALRTGRITWIGPQRPTALVADEDSYIHVSPQELVDLGSPFLLIDTPGTGDVRTEFNRLAGLGLSSARIKILVVDAKNIRSENYQTFISTGDGSLILPVVNFCKVTESGAYPIAQWQAQYRDELLQKLSLAAPAATILEPEFFPDRESRTSEEEAASYIRSRLQTTLRGIIADSKNGYQSIAARELQASYEKYLAKTSAILRPALDPLAPQLRELDDAIKSLPAKILHHLLHDSAQIRILIKSHFRGHLMDATPSLAFPYRSLAGLLLLTAGAWDRLILGIGGSLPSLLAAGYKTVRDQQSTDSALHSLREKVKPLLSEMVRETVRTPLMQIHHKLHPREKGEALRNEPSAIDFDIQGIEELATSWNLEVDAAARQTKPSRPFFVVTGLLGTLAFWFLFGAPLIHLYGQYVPAALTSWHGEWTLPALQSYPALSSGFWLTALALSVIPTFLIALCTAATTLARSRAARAESLLADAMKTWLEDPALPLTLTIHDQKIQSLRTILESTIQPQGTRYSKHDPKSDEQSSDGA